MNYATDAPVIAEPELPAAAVSAPARRWKRRFAQTVRRHWLALLAIFCLLWSAMLLLAPSLGRRYDLAATLNIKTAPFAALPQLAALPAEQVRQFHPADREKGVFLHAQSAGSDGAQVLTLSASAP